MSRSAGINFGLPESEYRLRVDDTGAAVSCYNIDTDTEYVGGGTEPSVEIEIGAWTPTEDVTSGIIYFENPHISAPVYVFLYDSSTDNLAENDNVFYTLTNIISICGFPYEQGTSMKYGAATVCYAAATYLTSTSPTVGSESALNDLISNEWFKAYELAATRYWRAGHTYHWIAIFKNPQ